MSDKIDPKEKKKWRIQLLDGETVKLTLPKFCRDCMRYESGEDRISKIEPNPTNDGGWIAECGNPNCKYRITSDEGEITNMRW